MSLFVLRLLCFHRDIAVTELITCCSSQASRHRRGFGSADRGRQTFHSIKQRRREQNKKTTRKCPQRRDPYRFSWLMFRPHYSQSHYKNSATGNLSRDVARISRGRRQIPELIESQSVSSYSPFPLSRPACCKWHQG